MIEIIIGLVLLLVGVIFVLARKKPTPVNFKSDDK
jgi:hypothetical protein